MTRTETNEGPRQRSKCYAWVTWFVGLCSGESMCEWSAWYKAHVQGYEKRVDANNDLSVWQAEHATMVRARAEELERDGWDVTVENQNAFTIKGETIDVAGKIDILAVRGTEARVEDCKTGKRKEKDFWQLCAYGIFAPRSFPNRVGSRALSGGIVYRDGIRQITSTDFANARQILFGRIKSLGTTDEPKKTPSLSECRFCDIASCESRVDEQSNVSVATEF